MGNSRPGGAPGNVARGNAEAVTEAPGLRPHGGPGTSGSGSPGRSTPLPGGRERGSTGGNVMTPSYERQQNRAVEEARLGASSLVKKSSVANSLSVGSDRSSGSRTGAEEQVTSEHASNGDAGSSSKKRRKRMDSRSYIKKFKTGVRPGASDVAVAYPDRMGKENTSSGHVTDSNTAILCEGSRLIEKSKGHSSHAACKVSKSPISGLHETSDTRVDQCSTPLSEVQPHKPTDVQNIAAESSLPAKARDPHTGLARQNILSSLQSVAISTIHHEELLPHKRTDVQDVVAESSLPVKDRDQHTGPARQNILPSLQSVPISTIHHEEVLPHKCTDVQDIAGSLPVKDRDRHTSPARQNILPSLQSVPISTIHHEEIKSTLGDAEPISVQKENSAPGHLQVARSDGTDGNPNICVACGLGTPGTFRSCDGKGCKSRYHMSCLDQYLSLGNWFCTSCTKKRFQFGLHHIVDGIESVWDVKEAEGMQTSKQYFVKYKNLAHVHNRWVPEGDISVMPGGPDLLSLFNKRNHTEKTIRKEWTKPHRLLRKRLLVPPRLAEDFFCSDDFFCSSGVSYCTLEWLVKWRGLGYDHATWELETLSCLCTPEADELKENYENRREAAKQSSIPQKAKVKQSSFQKLERLPDGCHPDFDNDHLYSVNHLREYWHKSRGAVLVDDKEYVIKTVLFTMSVLPDVSQPFLILTTPGSLSLWEVQFNKLAPFVNVVVYDGGKHELKLIRDLEFYESGSRSMLQVLLSHPDAILEDIEPIARIGWEAVIVDYYQKSALQYLEQLKQFRTDFRMLLVSSPIKDNLPEYVKLLAFLNSGEQENGNYVDTAETLVTLEGNFKSHIAYERQADSSKILEHWVPAEEANESRRKRRKVGEITGPSSKSSPDNEHNAMLPENCSASSPALLPLDDTQQKSGVEKRISTPKNLHVQLKKELSKLIKALQLPDDVRAMAEQLFEYFLKNHLVVTEPVGILHAIIIALCLHAASVLKYKINCGQLIALAGKNLNCECNEELAGFIYGRLRFPEEKDPNRAIETSINGQPVSVEDTQISWEETSTNLATNLRNDHMLQNKEMDHGNLMSGGPQEVSSGAERMISEEQEPIQETHRECHLSNGELPNTIVEKRTELVDNDHVNFTNGALQEISSGAEQMISEAQEPVQETHRECHFSNDELPIKIVEKRTELVDNDDGNFTNGALQEVSSVAEHMISEEQEPVQETHGACHLSNDDLPSMIVEKRMELIDNVFSLREKNILCKQQLEISGLDTYTQNNVIRLKEVCNLVLEHIRRSHIAEMTRSDKMKLTVQWFTMLMCAFLEHMRLQHNKLEALQSDSWLVERHLKENLHQVAKSGQLDQDFDQHIALPDSNFVMEEFIHFKEQNDQKIESSVSDNQQPLDDGLLMEIALVRNEVLSGAISTQAMGNEPVATSVDSGEGPASETVDLPESSINCSSDGMGVQRAGCSSSTIPANDDSVGQESSTGECRNTEHVEADNIANPNMLLEGADSLVRGLDANNDDTVDTDQVHLESPILAASQSPIAAVGTQADLSSMSPEQSTDLSAQLNAAPSGHPPTEAEQTGLLGTQVVQDLQPEMQPSVLLSDAPLQKMHPDDRSQSGCQPDRATGLSQGGTSTSYNSGEVRIQANAKNDGKVTADRVLSESPTYTAHSPATLPVSTEFETQTCQSSMHVEQSVSVPAQQSLATCQSSIYQVCLLNKACDLQPEVEQSTSMQDQPAEERAYILGATAALGSQPEVQPSTSTQDQPAEAEPAGTLGAISAQVLHPEMQSSTPTRGVPFVSSIPSLDPHAGVELSGTVTPHAIQPPASMPVEQSTSLPAQQSLATLHHPPAEAEPAGILATEAACDLQPEVRPVEAAGASVIGMTVAQDSQPELQISTTVQHALVERTRSEERTQVGFEPNTAASPEHDLQPEIQPSASMHDQPAGAEGAGMLDTTAAQDLQPELQTSTTVQHDPLERTRSEERRQAGFEANTAASPEHDLQSEIQPSASMCDQPAGAEGAGMVGSTAAQDLQPERQLSTTVQHIPTGPEQPTQLPPVTPLVFNNPIICDEPLRNELEKIIHWSTLLDKGHEDKRSQLQAERNQEIEKINRKYDSLLQQEDSAHRLKRTQLNGIYQKVYVSKSLAENFRRQFTPSVASHGRLMSPVMEQLPESSSAARIAASPSVIPSPSIGAAVHSSAGPYVRPPPVALPSSSRTVQSQSAMPGNLSGPTSPPFVPAPSLHASYRPAGPLSRAVQPQSVSAANLCRTMSPAILTPRPQGSYGPAGAAGPLRAASPHLQQLRMRPPYAIPIDHHQQQQLPAILGVPSGGQFVTESLRPAFPQPGAVLASMTPAGSAHQPMVPSASGSSPATPTYFVPPGRHPEPVWTPNPALTLAQLQQQASYLNMALGGSSTSAGPAAPGSQQHAGVAQIPAVLNHPGLEPSPPPNNPYMPARFGLEPGSSSGSPSSAAGSVGPSVEVVCLSDDEA